MTHPLQIARKELLAFALTLPGTREDHPWGESVAKVGDKIFVFLGKSESHDPRLQFAVKLPRSGLAALDLGFTEPTGYGMGKHGWVTATYQEGDRPDLSLARTWVIESYRAIASKKLVAELDARGAPALTGATNATGSGSSSTAALPARQAARARSAKSPAKRKPTAQPKSASAKSGAGAKAGSRKKSKKSGSGRAAR